MSYQLPTYRPRWANWLGLRIDHDSRPGRGASYHDNDYRTQVVVGWQGFLKWGLRVSRYEEYTTLNITTPFVDFYRRVGSGGDIPVGEMAVCWGWYIYGEKISGSDLVLEWGAHSKRIALNPFRWDGYERLRLVNDATWANPHEYTETKPIRLIERDDWYSEEHPYRITSEPAYYGNAGFHEIRVWDATATCYVDKSVRTRRWLPFWMWVSYHVYFDLSDEVGRGKGSWKGGTVGFSEELLPGDYIHEVVARAARKGRGR